MKKEKRRDGSLATKNMKRMKGHWLLAKMGKRVLRPGGLALTKYLLQALDIGRQDAVVELAPGLGRTASLTLEKNPASYTGVERDAQSAQLVKKVLRKQDRCVVGSAEQTGLDEGSADIVYGEAMLTMQSLEQKKAILQEVKRILKPGGKYAIHELALEPDDLPKEQQELIKKELSDSIHVGAGPLLVREWQSLFEEAGFSLDVQCIRKAPMHLLEPARLLADEGFWRTLRFVCNVLFHADARKRIVEMRRVFRQFEENLCAVVIVVTS